MTLTDGRRVRHDMGPCPTEGARKYHTSVMLPTGFHEEALPNTGCVVCSKPIPPGRVACSGCHLRYMGRRSW